MTPSVTQRLPSQIAWCPHMLRACRASSPPSTRSYSRWPTGSPLPVEPSTGFSGRPASVLVARDLAQDEPTLPEGTSVGPYRIVGLLARGGMGTSPAAVSQRADAIWTSDGTRSSVSAGSQNHCLSLITPTSSGVRRRLSNGSLYLVVGAARRRDLAGADRQRGGATGRCPQDRFRSDARPGGRALARAGPSRSQA